MEITSAIKEDFVILDEETTVSQMIGKLKQFEKRSGLVFKNKKYLGLVEKKRLLRSNINASEVKIKQYLQKTPILSEHADVIETAYLMYQSNLDFLPVESNNVITGVLNALDIAALGLNLDEAKAWKVKDVKFLKSKKVNKDDPISTVIELMHKEKIDQVPIFDQGKLYGMVTYKDILRKYINWSPKRDISTKFNKMASSKSAEVDVSKLSSLPVSDFSTNDNLISTKSNGSLKEAMMLMLKNDITSLPILDGNEVEGLLTVKNVLRVIASLKVPKNFNIRFVGLNSLRLEPHQKYNLKKIASNESFKLQRQIKNNFDLVIHIKGYEKEGGNQKFSVHMRIDYPGQMLTSSQDDWDLETALRKTFNNAKNNVGSKFKTEGKRKRED
ncbi:MAG: CBS domain-containing protein [Candidatus Woesearchaeota archaeon]